MTALIRGFGDQLEELIRGLGSDTVYVQKMGITSFSSGKTFWELAKRPNLTEADANAIREGAPSAAVVAYSLGGGGGPGMTMERLAYGSTSTRRLPIVGSDANWLRVNFMKLATGTAPVGLRGAAPAPGRHAGIGPGRNAVPAGRIRLMARGAVQATRVGER